MSTADVEQLRKFVFKSRASENHEEEKLEIIIPELLQASYSFYTWPSAPILAWFLWEHRKELVGLHVLELGSGTALPGIVASKCGAEVTLTDSITLPKSLAHITRSCELNKLIPNQHIRIAGLSWGLFLTEISSIGPVDLILGSDCFYEPSVFEDIIITVSYCLEENPNAKFLCAYQERSSDWSIEHLLVKWNLKCKVINTSSLGESAGVDIRDLVGDHTIHLLEVTK
ncbi:methyltransferase-like protein 23 isoform X1 [Agrilus planipennis]|uniref:Methyltransferase-like protein 23 isoform X1 n=1 Tax=Agrilus planipennis TaxID=224129 RepID=A0A1W4XE69_AGRPL|nr:methyltransferase-like protein 23 isoform X1 [Agrilus planipennis]